MLISIAHVLGRQTKSGIEAWQGFGEDQWACWARTLWLSGKAFAWHVQGPGLAL